ncbi:MAG: hypothetical protein WD076_08270, partial [Parvularculaceae bacterium]
KEKAEETTPAQPAAVEESAPVEEAAAPTNAERLDAALAVQDDAAKARYVVRHPKETLEFFGVEPGMTVVDVLPGEGWYTKILLPYLGANGAVIGADYSIDMWPLFGEYAPDLEKQKVWTTTWTGEAQGWCEEDCASVGAFVYGAVPEDMKGKADAVLFMRALHHFNRFEDNGGYFTAALKETMDVLKPGGVVGVEQHRAPVGNSDQWANGDNGYLKQDQVIAAFQNAGFEFVGSSEINANPKDVPTEEDFVWRLPPAFATSRENPELKAQMEAIGESDRMTLKFKKPE